MNAHGYAPAYAGEGRPAGRRAPPRRSAGLAALLLESAARRPFRTVGILLATIMAGFIVVNAVGLQERRHPAPLFAIRSPEQAAPAQPRQAQPVTQAQPQADRRAPAIEPPARPQDLGTAAHAPPAAQPASGRHDPIGDLLRGNAPAPAARSAATPAQPVAAREPDAVPAANQRIASAQRALTKLGYGPLKADGVVGIGTRLALENFEKDRRLPLTGELSPRVARELQAASGIAIE